MDNQDGPIAHASTVAPEPPASSRPKLHFACHDHDAFVAATKAVVADHFGTRSSSGNAAILVRTAVMASGLFGPYLLILLLPMPDAARLALCVVMGVALAGIGFGVSHDALHDSLSGNPRLNAILGMSFDLLGASSYMWKITHNVIHHTYTNIHGVDEDLEVSPLLRLSPHARRRAWHRFQHLYAPLAYSLSTLNWIFIKDFDYFSRRRLGPYVGRHHPRRAWTILVVSKLVAVTWMLVIPLLVLPLPWWEIVAGFLVVHLVGGFILGIIFQLAHVVEQTAHPVPDDMFQMPNGWLVHQTITTANFCVGNRPLTWYVGGLNHQIEHHLFPKVSSVHYAAISGAIKRVALEHGIPYHHNPTLLGAIGSHLRTLKALGAGA